MDMNALTSRLPLCAVAILAMARSIQPVASGEAQVGAGDFRTNGKELRAEIQTAYQQLKASKPRQRGKDVTAIVTKYIPLGTPFRDAEAILLAAGCSSRGVTIHGNPLCSMHLASSLAQTVTFSVELGPPRLGDSDAVQEISGSIFYEYL
jgi:hypothetical protein